MSKTVGLTFDKAKAEKPKTKEENKAKAEKPKN